MLCTFAVAGMAVKTAGRPCLPSMLGTAGIPSNTAHCTCSLADNNLWAWQWKSLLACAAFLTHRQFGMQPLAAHAALCRHSIQRRECHSWVTTTQQQHSLYLLAAIATYLVHCTLRLSPDILE